MFWRKKTKKKIEKPTNTLTIKTKSTDTHSWTVHNWTGKDIVEPWRRFYKWYFSHKPNDFIMRYAEGQAMFRRDEILFFKVRIGSELVDEA